MKFTYNIEETRKTLLKKLSVNYKDNQGNSSYIGFKVEVLGVCTFTESAIKQIYNFRKGFLIIYYIRLLVG